MKRSFLPSLAALQAFECAARHMSFTRAAEELNLTQGAVSRQIRHMEEVLGVTLFERVRRQVVLTDAGRLYLLDIQRMIEGIEQATQRVASLGGGADILNIASLPTFAARWLIPRLPAFYAENPGVLVNFATRLQPFDFEAEPFDGAIHFGRPAWAGAVAHFLFPEGIVPVASPQFRRAHGIAAPQDLARLPLLQQSTRPTAWSEWYAMMGVAAENAMRGARYDQFSLCTQAAAAGLGVALVPRYLVAEEVASGVLEILFDTPLRGENAYYFVVPETKLGLPLVERFKAWLTVQAEGANQSRGAAAAS